MKNLTHLRLHENFFHGTIPVANLNNATGIYINHNSLKGTIPSEIEGLEHLEFLHLHQDQLHGLAFQLKTPSNSLSVFGYITDCGDPIWLLPDKLGMRWMYNVLQLRRELPTEQSDYSF